MEGSSRFITKLSTAFLVGILSLGALNVSTAFGFDIKDYEKKIVQHTLENGLTVIILPRHDAPVASLVTYANVGSVDDPKGFTGMAHVFEHMAFKGDDEIGTNNIKGELKAIAAEEAAFLAWRAERFKGEVADSAMLVDLEKTFRDAQETCDGFVVTNELGNIVEREGFVGLNAFTSSDQTAYLYNFPENKLELAIMLEASRFSSSVLREYYKEVDVVKEERRMRSESSPIGKLVEEFLAAAFKAHPYGVPTIGHMSDLGNYSREEAMTFFNKYYVPNNLCIAIVGDVNPKEVIKYTEKYFGGLKRGADVMRIQTIEPPQAGERRVAVEDKSETVWLAGFHVPAGGHPDRPALDALVDYLGSGRTSLLYKSLVKDSKKAINVAAFTGFPGEKYPGLVAVFAMAAKDVTPEELETLILADIERMKEEKLSEQDVEEIRARAKSGFINQLNSRQGLAIQLATYQMVDGDWRDLFRQLEKINAVTADDIQRVAAEYSLVLHLVLSALGN
ncbi:insulinase family protein [bacterium AH-315-J21]|nr:insulinase family protein [bacterium AH-315-J21]